MAVTTFPFFFSAVAARGMPVRMREFEKGEPVVHPWARTVALPASVGWSRTGTGGQTTRALRGRRKKNSLAGSSITVSRGREGGGGGEQKSEREKEREGCRGGKQAARLPPTRA